MTIRTDFVIAPDHPFIGLDAMSILSRQLPRRASHPCLVWGTPEFERTWTYETFVADVESTAAGLSERGVGEGTPVLVHLENSPAFLMVWFACARLGAVAVDVNARSSLDELRHAIDLTGTTAVVTNDPHVASEIGDGAWSLVVNPDIGIATDLFGDASKLTVRAPDPTKAVCIQFTSGSTSRPKAVLYSHANALWGARESAEHWGLEEDDVQLVFAPLFHTLALYWQTLSTLWVGGTVVLQSKFSISQFWDVSKRHECTRTTYMPLLRHVVGTQPVPVHRYRSWIAGAQESSVQTLFDVDLFSTWGMTEVVTQPIFALSGDGADEGDIGFPARHYEIRVRRDDGELADADDSGELLVRGERGVSLFCEYFGDAATTAAAFDAEGFFRTGDRVKVQTSGALAFVDRSKDMLKVGGENVAASEIERVVLATPGVGEAAVVGRSDVALSEVPVAFVIAMGDDAPVDLSARVIEHCAAMLADFKVPRAVYIVDEFPRAINKVHKARLRAHANALRQFDVESGRLDRYPDSQ